MFCGETLVRRVKVQPSISQDLYYDDNVYLPTIHVLTSASSHPHHGRPNVLAHEYHHYHYFLSLSLLMCITCTTWLTIALLTLFNVQVYPLHDVPPRDTHVSTTPKSSFAQIDLWRIEGGVMWRTRLDRNITLHLSVYRTVRNIR